MLDVLFELDLLGQLVHITVDQNTHVARATGIGKDLLLRALLLADNGCKHLKAGALGKRQDAVKDLINGLLTDLLSAHGTVRNTDARIKKAQIVVDLRNGTDGGARVFRGGLLVDGDRGRKPLDKVHVGLVHLP